MAVKRSCKHVCIRDVDTIKDWVSWCVARHYDKRRDFVRLMAEHGYVPLEDHIADSDSWWKAIESISRLIISMIENRKLELEPVRISEKVDKNSGKMRLIGCESALQQCIDYVAVYSCMEIWQRRIDPLQASSLSGRGQIFILHKLQKALKKDHARQEYGRKHGIRYSLRYRYLTKTDVKSCFKSGDKDKFLAMFSRDCANEDIIWLWGALFETHRVWYYDLAGNLLFYMGFLIGSLISQFAMIYMLSFASTLLRGMVNAVYCFMDDFVILDSVRKLMKKAILVMRNYLYDTFGLVIKATWNILKLDDATPVDFVGYRVYTDGKIEMRRRNAGKLFRYIRMPFLTFKQCKTIASMKGLVDHSSSYKLCTKYNFHEFWRRVICIIRIRNLQLCQAA